MAWDVGKAMGWDPPFANEYRPMTDPKTYRVRYRFRLQKKLSVSENERRLTVARREVVVSSQMPDTKINAGVDKPTSGFGKIVKDAMYEKEDISLRDNVHGVDVFLDELNIRIGHFSATGTVRSAADPFLSEIDELYKVVDGASKRAKDIVLLLNYALMRTDPVAMIVKQLLADLATAAEQSAVGTVEERAEVAVAIGADAARL
jgi:hypothetical protein